MPENAAAEQYNVRTCEEISLQSGKQECSLPNTGLDVGVVGGIGLLVVVAGIALKRVISKP